MKFRATVHRSIVDWYQRERSARSRRHGDDGESSGEPRIDFPGAVGVIGPRIVFELDDRLAQNLLSICDRALASDDLSDGQRGQIEQTKSIITTKLAEASANPDQ